MRKNIKIAFKKLSLVIATSLVVSALSPLATMAEEISADLVGVEVASENLTEEAGLTSETEADYVTLDSTEWDGIIVDGQATEENLLLPAESAKLASASVASTEDNDEDATSTASTNFAYNASYIGKIEKKGEKPLATRKVEFYTSKKYRISNTTEAIANPGGDISIGF